MRNGVREFIGMSYSAVSAYKYFVKCLNKELLSTNLVGYYFYYEELVNSHKITLFYFNNISTMKHTAPKGRFMTDNGSTVYRMIFSIITHKSLLDKSCSISVDFKRTPLNLSRSGLKTYPSAHGLNFAISDMTKGDSVNVNLLKIEEVIQYIKKGCNDNFISDMSKGAVSLNNRVPFNTGADKVFVAMDDKWINYHEFYGLSKITKEIEIKKQQELNGEEDDYVINDLKQHLTKNISEEMRNSIQKAIDEYREKKRKEKLDEEIRKNDESAYISLLTVRNNYLEKKEDDAHG